VLLLSYGQNNQLPHPQLSICAHLHFTHTPESTFYRNLNNLSIQTAKYQLMLQMFKNSQYMSQAKYESRISQLEPQSTEMGDWFKPVSRCSFTTVLMICLKAPKNVKIKSKTKSVHPLMRYPVLGNEAPDEPDTFRSAVSTTQ